MSKGARTKQKVIWAFLDDITKLRRKKKVKIDGKMESDAETLNRLLREIESSVGSEMDRDIIRMDVRFNR
jgi:dissimilatory sulfite reductase (desulfoviridin) alpha/beta subunit